MDENKPFVLMYDGDALFFKSVRHLQKVMKENEFEESLPIIAGSLINNEITYLNGKPLIARFLIRYNGEQIVLAENDPRLL